MESAQEKLKQILAEAIAETEPSGRAAYLDEACGCDLALRAKIEGLLRAYESHGSALEETLAMAPPVAEGAGTVIGHYKLLEQIGEGGFGVVFMAEQMAPMRRRVALKIVKPGMDTKQVIARFEAERQALALMDHASIARVFDAGATETGRPYFVMELVQGVPITHYCDANELTPQDRLKLFVTVCEAVQHAHQKGIIHRDLKPSNILVTSHDGKPVPKVIDFGTAKALQQPLTEKTLFTGYGKLIGTPQYMSPEQAEMSGLDVDTRADIYSLGVLLYELLTGTTPFEADRLRTAAFSEMMRVIREEEPPKPSTRVSTLGARATAIAKHRQADPALLRRTLQGDLDWILMKALDKDRSRRYQAANTFAEDLERHLNHQPVLASPPGAPYRARKFIRRHRMGVATAAALTTALAAGLIISLVGFSHARLERDRARVAEAKTETERSISAAVNEFLLEDLLRQASPNEQSDREVKLRTLLDRAAAKVESRFESKPLIEAQIRETLGSVYESLGQYTNARAHFERALQLYRAHYGAEDPRTIKARRETLSVMRRSGELGTGVKLAEELVALQRRVQGPEHAETLESLYLLAWFYQDQDKLKEAEELMRTVVATRRRTLGPEHRDTLAAMGRLASIYLNQAQTSQPSKIAEARALYEQLLELDRRIWGADHPETIGIMASLAAVSGIEGKTLEAQKLLSESLKIQLRVLGREHPVTLKTMYNLALTHQFQGEFKESAKLYEDLIELQRQALGPEHADTLQTMLNLGVVLINEARQEKGDKSLLDHADQLLEQVYVGREHPLGSKHIQTLRALLAQALVGRAYLDHGHPHDAQRVLEQTLSRQTAKVGAEHPDALASRNLLAGTMAAQDKLSTARKMFQETIKLGERGLSARVPETPESLDTQLAVAFAYGALGKFGQARNLYEQVLGTRTRVHGREHPLTQETLNELAAVCAQAGELDDAQKFLNDRLPGQLQFQGPSHPETLDTRKSLACFATTLGQWPAALEQCREYAAIASNDVPALRRYALAAALAGQGQVCREQCARLLATASTLSNDLSAVDLAATTCLVAAEFAPDLPMALRLAARAVDADRGSTNAFAIPSKLLEGLATYRAGRPEQTVSLLEPLASAGRERGLLAHYFLSLARQELNQPGKAKASLLEANRRLEEHLHTGMLVCQPESPEEIADMSSVLLVRSEAERKVLGRIVSPKPDAESLAAARRTWRLIVESLIRARDCGLEERWQEAADAIEQALQQRAFKWGTARLEWPDMELWMGIAVVRSGNLQRHTRFCRRLAEAVPECAHPNHASMAAAQVCLLPPSPAPELLGIASNLLAQADVEFPEPSSREDRQLARGLLAHRTDRDSEVAALVKPVSSSTNLHHRATAQVLNALAARKLGRKAEAEDILSKAKSLVPEATESGITPARFPDLHIFLLLLDEANGRPLVL